VPEDLSVKRTPSLVPNVALPENTKPPPRKPETSAVHKQTDDNQGRSDLSAGSEQTGVVDSVDSVDSEGGGGVDPADLSPLEQMQYIANSLSSPFPPGTGGYPISTTSNIRTNLPTITTEQWERCSDLSTDDVVSSIKDMLSEYSISQRLFGEAVLGLSQGSVSDLLARPKAWSMLTQKGREPFVRMQLFLDDPSSVNNLVASQYRVPADKLLRSNSAGCTDTPTTPQGIYFSCFFMYF